MLALVYFLAWPRRKVEGMRRGLRYFVVRWFHGLVWVLLGVSLSLHAVSDEPNLARPAAKILAVLALVAYAAFVFAAYGPRRAADADTDTDTDTDTGDVTGPRAR
jgi:hypothetical protein